MFCVNGGDLLDTISRRGHLGEKSAKFFFYQILVAVSVELFMPFSSSSKREDYSSSLPSFFPP
jgi:hypothetical protein